MTARKGQTPTLPILNAVDALYSQIRKNHPDVPPATIVLGAKGTSKRGQTHGHFHANQWKHDEAVHEIMLSGESLARGAEATLGTLIHEAAHATAYAREVQDTSNNGRYHNKRFKQIAEELGVSLEAAPTLGWSLTTLPEETAKRYSKGLDALREALVAYKMPSAQASAPKKPRKSTKIKIDCECGTPVTVSKIWFESKGEITCGDCLSPLMEVDA